MIDELIIINNENDEIILKYKLKIYDVQIAL